MTMCDSNSVQFVRIYNQAPLKQMCASFLKQHYISNVHRTLDKCFAKEFSASEMSYLNGRSKDKLLPVMLHTLSMSSSTFLPFSSDVMGKYDNVFLCKEKGFKGFPLECLDFFWCRDFLTQIFLIYCHIYATLNPRIIKHKEEYA